jgi:hypothetical protein
VIVALSMACLGAVKADGKVKYDLARWFDDDAPQDLNRQNQLALNRFMMSGGL